MSTNEKQQQLGPRERSRSFRAVLPTEREVLLARLLLQLVDHLGAEEAMPIDLYEAVKSFAEPLVRST